MDLYQFLGIALKEDYTAPDYQVTAVTPIGDDKVRVNFSYDRLRANGSVETVTGSAVINSSLEYLKDMARNEWYEDTEFLEITQWSEGTPALSPSEADVLDALADMENWATEADRNRYLVQGFVD